jgi:hypothetical protein
MMDINDRSERWTKGAIHLYIENKPHSRIYFRTVESLSEVRHGMAWRGLLSGWMDALTP